MTPTIEEVVKGLTPTMREALCWLPNGYFDPNTVRALRKRGLLLGCHPTDLGIACRSYLMEKNNGK